METIVFLITMIGGSLAIALLFASTVLSYKWWNLPLFHRHHTSKDSQQKRQGNSELIPQHKVVEVKSQSKSQSLVQLRRISNWSELTNKKVKTCEMVDVGNIIAIDKQSMTILHDTKQQYIIPTYYLREYNRENVVIDISIRYLNHYKPE